MVEHVSTRMALISKYIYLYSTSLRNSNLIERRNCENIMGTILVGLLLFKLFRFLNLQQAYSGYISCDLLNRIAVISILKRY